jgi:hypothetical protein
VSRPAHGADRGGEELVGAVEPFDLDVAARQDLDLRAWASCTSRDPRDEARQGICKR